MIRTALTERESEFLGMVAASCVPRHFLEIGAQYGHSTLILAREAELSDGFVVSIDHHRGDADAGYALTCNDFLMNITDYTYVIIPIVAPTVMAQMLLSRDLDFSLAFVDGGHDYESVSIDVRLVAHKLRIPKLLFHDYGRHWTVTEAVDSLEGYDLVRVVDTMAYLEARDDR